MVGFVRRTYVLDQNGVETFGSANQPIDVSVDDLVAVYLGNLLPDVDSCASPGTCGDQWCFDYPPPSLGAVCVEPPPGWKSEEPACRCEGETLDGTSWPASTCGLVAKTPCTSPSVGDQTRNCTFPGVFSDVNVTLCSNAQISQLANAPVTQETALGVISSLGNFTTSAEKLGTSDIENAISIISKTFEALKGTITNEVMSLVGNAIDNLLGASNESAAKGQEEFRQSSGDTLPNLVDKFLSDLIKTIPINEAFVYVGSRFAVNVISVSNGSDVSLPLACDANSSTCNGNAIGGVDLSSLNLQIPGAAVQGAGVQVALYGSDKFFVTGPEGSGGTVNSNVMSVTLDGVADGQLLAEPFVFTLPKLSTGAIPAQALCSYWVDNVSVVGATGFWTQDGCSLTSENATHVTCQCTHLTNFAVLASPSSSASESSIGEDDALSLSIITYIGLAISIPCLVLTVAVYVYFKSLRKVSKLILMHLCFNLAVALVTFVAGIDSTSDRDGCKAVAIILHWFLLNAFLWMLVEGYHIHYTFTAVFDARAVKQPLLKYSLFAYGVSTLIVIISAGGWQGGYGNNENNCWLSTDGERLIWAFVGPLIVIIFINLVFFIRLLRVILRMPISKGSQSGSSGDRRTRATRALKTSATFFCLMGLTWIFGALAVGEASLAFMYLFAIFNAFQGVFIFYFHCYTDPQLREVYRKQMERRSVSSTLTRSKDRKFTTTSYLSAEDSSKRESVSSTTDDDTGLKMDTMRLTSVTSAASPMVAEPDVSVFVPEENESKTAATPFGVVALDFVLEEEGDYLEVDGTEERQPTECWVENGLSSPQSDSECDADVSFV